MVRLSQCVEGFLMAGRARRLSENTLIEYLYTFQHLQRFCNGDPELARITAQDIRAFLASRTGVSNKTVLNNWVGLSALWTWAVAEGLAPRNVVRDVPAPKAQRPAIVPYTQKDVKAMLGACDRTEAYQRPGQRVCDNGRPTALRDRAMILLLLDTGIRASELCELRVFQVDLRNLRVTVLGKGSKERMVPFSSRTGQAVWKYLASSTNGEDKSGCLFLGRDGQPLARSGLRHVLQRIGERAGVEGVTVHRFRHTFAIEFLRNHPNVFALKRMLGHESLEMVQRYLDLVQADVEKAHQDASPVAHWRL